METINLWRAIAIDSITNFGENLMGGIPNLIITFFLLVFGLLIAKLVSITVRKLLEKTKIDALNEKLADTELFQENVRSFKFSNIIARFIYWIIVLVFIITATETLGMKVVSERLADLVNYIPRLLSALIIAILGLLIASFVRNFIRSAFESLNIEAGKLIGTIVFYFMGIIVVLSALDQARIDVSIITTNLSLILGSVLLSFALAFIIGTRDIMPSIISSQKSSDSIVQIGKKIKIGDVEGEVISKDKLYVVLKDGDKTILIPNQQLLKTK